MTTLTPRRAGIERITPATARALGLPPVDICLIYVTADDGHRSTLVSEPTYAAMIAEALRDGEPFTLEPNDSIPVPLIADGFPTDWTREHRSPVWNAWTA